MNLLDKYKEPFVMLDKRSIPDGFGGVYYEWTEGASFQAALHKLSDSTALVAEQETGKSVFKLLFDKRLTLNHGDRVRQTKTGQAFLITSESRDMYTPGSSPLQLAQCTAERVTV